MNIPFKLKNEELDEEFLKPLGMSVNALALALRVPATRIGDLMVFGTVRRNSRWIKNLAATPDVRYWLAGRPREAAAIVFTPEHTELMPLATLPRRATWLAPLLQLQSQTFGVSFALLTPRS